MKRHTKNIKESTEVPGEIKIKKVRPLTSNEVQKYIEDVAKSMSVDLSDADYDDTQRMLNKVSSLSQEIVKHRNA
jgi:hypothetical protein